MKNSIICILVIFILFVIVISYYFGVENGRKMVALQLADSSMSYQMCLRYFEEGKTDQVKQLIEESYLSNTFMSLQYLRLNCLTPIYQKIPSIIKLSFLCSSLDDRSLSWNIFTYKIYIEHKKNRNKAEEVMLNLLNTNEIRRLLTKLNELSLGARQKVVPASSCLSEEEELMYASGKGDISSVQALLRKGANVNAKDKTYGNTALMCASEDGHLDVVNLLLSKGADVNAKANNGTTALWSAVTRNHIEITKSLIDNGADVNEKDGYGATALMYASKHGNNDIVKLLIYKGADVNAKMNNNMTAIKIAQKDGHADTVEILKQAGAME